MENKELLSDFEIFGKNDLENWNDHKYKIEYYGDEPKVIMMGESHNDNDIIEKQLNLIEKIKPDFVLHEFAGGLIYNPVAKNYEKQENRRFNEFDLDPDSIDIPKKLIELSDMLGFKIISCDLTSAEINSLGREIAKENPNEFEFDEEFEHLYKPDDPDWILTMQSDEIIPYRDKRIVQTILEYQGKSFKPLVVIMGKFHGDNIHCQKLIQNKGFGYAYVDQTSKKSN